MGDLGHERSIATLVREAEGGWEDVDGGTVPHDEDHPVVVVEPEASDPVQQTPLSNDQPTELDRLPVDDDDYEPKSADELGRAARLLLSDMPDEVVGWLWRKMRTLRDKVRQNMDDVGGHIDEATLRRIVREQLLAEAKPKPRRKAKPVDPFARDVEGGVYADEPSPDELAAIEKGDDWDVPDTELVEPAAKGARQAYGGGKGKKPAMAVMGISDDDAAMLASIASKADLDELDPADRVADEEEAEAAAGKTGEKRGKKYVTAGDEGMSLKDIAKEMGFSGASGVKNLLYQVEDKMRYFAALDEVWFKRLMETFARAYVEELKDAVGENLDAGDVTFLDELMDDPDTVMRLPEFRMWARDYLKEIHKGKLGKAAKD